MYHMFYCTHITKYSVRTLEQYSYYYRQDVCCYEMRHLRTARLVMLLPGSWDGWTARCEGALIVPKTMAEGERGRIGDGRGGNGTAWGELPRYERVAPVNPAALYLTAGRRHKNGDPTCYVLV
jgi:hypothetical protein